MRGKHAQNNLGAAGALPPNPLSLKTRGGGVGGGSHTRTGPAPPPPGSIPTTLSSPLSKLTYVNIYLSEMDCRLRLSSAPLPIL